MKVLRGAKFSPYRVPRLAALIMLGLILTIITTGCGKKGPVRPKLSTIPKAPTEVALHQQGKTFVLSWTIPSRNQDGSKAEDLTGFRIKRLSYDSADACPTCREPQETVAELDSKQPSPGQLFGKRIYWRDQNINPDDGYRYSISTVTLGGLEGGGATVHRAAQSPPPPPTNLTIDAGDGQASLQWLAPSLPAEMKLVGYNLYRKQSKQLFPIVPVNSKPLQKTWLFDRGLENGRAYEYRLSTVVHSDELLLESMPGNSVMVTPQEGH